MDASGLQNIMNHKSGLQKYVSPSCNYDLDSDQFMIWYLQNWFPIIYTYNLELSKYGFVGAEDSSRHIVSACVKVKFNLLLTVHCNISAE
jgi:hypothetical protein